MDHAQKKRCRACCVTALVLIVILASIAVVLWLILRPHPPLFNLKAVCATVLSGPANCSQDFPGVPPSAYPPGAILYALGISNRDNELGIFYNDLNVTISLGRGIGGPSVQRGFYQGHGQTTLRQGWLDGSWVPWAELMPPASQRASGTRQLVRFLVRVDGSFRYKGVLVKKTGLHVVALNGAVFIDAEGRMPGGTIRLAKRSAAQLA